MPQIKPEIETFAKIKVVGVGGSGGSAVNRMLEKKIKGIEFIVMNTDVQALHHNRAPKKLNIGKSITRGLGAGMNPEVGRKAAEESQNEIRDMIKDAHMIFITCGLGGGTGSGASPLVAEIARDLGILTVAVVTKPFRFEGPKRAEIAEEALENLSQNVDAIITVSNDKILEVIDKKASFLESFKLCDDILRQGIQGISEVITVPGEINVDFEDVKTIMQDAGSALMGIGVASGENRAAEAAEKAVSSPLLELSIDGASGILFTISGNKDLGMKEVEEAAEIITSSASEDAKVIFGTVIDESLGDDIRISVVATGFDDRRPKSINREEDDALFAAPKYKPSSFLQRIKKTEQEEVDEFKGYTQHQKKSDSEDNGGRGFNTGFTKKSIKTREPEIKQESSRVVPQDELEIPAFIRKKMGK